MSTPYWHRSPTSSRPIIRSGIAIFSFILLGACAAPQTPSNVQNAAQLTPATPSMRDLLKLPEPSSRITVAVYGFRDQTGQYKQAPDSDFSTAVTQGGASMLVKSLKDSGWFVPVEREGLQELLTERRILRAINEPSNNNGKNNAGPDSVPSLMPAKILIAGGVTAYDTNVRTGGVGAQFLGIGLSTQYRVDQVTVNLRSVDIKSGAVLQSVSTTKTIFSYEIHPNVFRFVDFKELLEIEAGVTNNEPAQLCVKEAIDAAVMHLAVEGLKDRSWALKNPNDWNSPIIQKYLHEEDTYALPDTPQPVAIANAGAVETSD